MEKSEKVQSIYDKAVELGVDGNYSMRSCWECNQSHTHLKEVGGLFTCIECGRWYMNGGFLDNDEHSKKPFVQLDSLKSSVITIIAK